MTPFAGTDRYEILRLLGQGGMGAVYQAFDKRRARPVAVKVLRDRDRGSLYRFKREFRSAADLQHSNLVQLYDLGVARDGAYFFTMELVLGRDLVSHVARLANPDRPDPALADTPPAHLDVADTLSQGSGPRRPGPELLAGLLCGVVEGLAFLHHQRKVHRDLKPSNILVDEGGVPRLLDFGILRELDRPSALTDAEGGAVGTPLYMSPEQVRGREITPAADLYSMGCVIYELLAGHPPFHGGPAQGILMRHLSEEPTPPSARQEVDPVLELLCLELLAKDPLRRPGAAEVLARLHRDAGGPPPRRLRRAQLAGPGLIGRTVELARLERPARGRASERPWLTVIRGESGAGKSALLQELVERVSAGGGAVFQARCYEREQVPYKAFDAIVDALAVELVRDRSLLEASEGEISAADLQAMARVFPVLLEVPELQARAQKADPAEALCDAQAERVRALRSLLLLLRRLAGGVPPWLCIEDLHWADVESLEVLHWLARSPSAPACRVVVTTREVPHLAGRPLVELLRASDRVEDLVLPPLDQATMAELVAGWVLSQAGLDLSDGERAWLVAEARGNALVGVELARAYAATAGKADTLDGSEPGRVSASAEQALAAVSDQTREAMIDLARGVTPRPMDPAATGAAVTTGVRTLADLLERRLRGVSEAARLAFEAAAVAAGRATFALLVRASGLPGSQLATALDELLREQLLREGPAPGAPHGGAGEDAYDLFHERLREVAYARMPADRRRQLHLALAEVLAEADDPARAVEHWRMAGEPERARQAALEAARGAEEQLAFDRAAELYALAAGDPVDPEIELRRGRALGLAGRHAEAARAFQRVAERLGGGASREASLRAATEQLAAGDFAGGMAALDALLRSLGETLHRSKRARLMAILRHGLSLQVAWWFDDRARRRGRAPAPVPAAAPGRADDDFRLRVYEAAFHHLPTLDPLVSADFGVRFARLARRRGEPSALGRARIGHALLVTGMFQTPVESALAHLDAGEALCAQAGDRLGLLHGLMARSLAHLWEGNWEGVRSCAEKGEQLARRAGLFEEPVLMSVRNLHLAAELLVGDVARARRVAEAYLLDARPRGNVLEQALPTLILGLIHLYAGDGAQGREAALEALELCPAEPMTVLRVSVELNRVALALFEQNVEEGVAALVQTRRRWLQSGLLASSLDDVTYQLYGARLLLLARRLGHDPAPLAALDDFEARLKRALGRAVPSYKGQVARVLAALRFASGDAAGALPLLDRALWKVERGHTPLEEHLLRFARGTVRGRLGLPGATLDLEVAEEGLRQLGTADCFWLRVEGWRA